MLTTTNRIFRIINKYPMIRGMISYAVIWPCCSIAQEYIECGTVISHADWARAARFSFFGAFFMSPVFYGWMKYTQPFFKRNCLSTCLLRAAIEQVSYGPFALTYFLFGMSLLEMKSIEECVEEVKKKFWPLYKVGFFYWPTVQTLNFRFVAEKNRIIFVSGASFIWTVYMTHVKCKIKDKTKQDPKNIGSFPSKDL